MKWIVLSVAIGLLPMPAHADEPGPGRLLTAPLPEAPIEAPPPAAPRWVGPQAQLGYSFFRLSDGSGGGDVHAGDVGIFAQFSEPHVRLAFWGEIGGRDTSLGGPDVLVRGAVEAGVQFTEIDPLEMHASLVGTVGGVAGQRPDAFAGYVLGGVGIEMGAAVRFIRGLHLAVALSYLWVEMDGTGHDLFVLRLALGV